AAARQPALVGVALGFVASRENRAEAIRGLYFIHLRRAPSDDEVNSWLARMDNGFSLEQMQGAIAGSDECFQRLSRDNSRWLDGLYQDVLGRPRQGDATSQFWVGLLNLGLPRTAVVASILASDEARTLLIRGTFSKLLGRSAFAGDVAAWLPFFRGQAPAGFSLGEVFQAQVLASRELFRASGNTVGGWLVSVYNGVLDRDPDPAGYLANLATLLGQT